MRKLLFTLTLLFPIEAIAEKIAGELEEVPLKNCIENAKQGVIYKEYELKNDYYIMDVQNSVSDEKACALQHIRGHKETFRKFSCNCSILEQ